MNQNKNPLKAGIYVEYGEGLALWIRSKIIVKPFPTAMGVWLMYKEYFSYF